MSKLKLSSNFNENILHGVGSAALVGETITINTEEGVFVTLLRGVNKVTLLKESNQKQSVSGHTVQGDVYTLEKGDEKLILKIENDDITHETNLFVNSAPIVDATSTKRKTTLTAGILILIVLVVSVIFGVRQKSIKEFNLRSSDKLDTAILNYEKAIAEGAVDKNSARSLFVEAKTIATQLKEDGYKNEKLDELLKNINEKESGVLGEIKTESKELLDLTLQINGFSGNKIVSTGDTMFVFDEKEKNIIQLNIDGKDAKIVAKKDVLDGALNIASYEDRLFTLNNDGIYEIDGTRNKVKDKDWGESLFYLYSANIYLVDKGDNKIYRFSGNGKTFGDKSEWLAPGIEVDFSKVMDMSIDGSIWLLSSSGKVTRFTNGNPTSITMNGIVTPLESPTAIYTNEDLKNVYVLDKENGRVVVIEKNGTFKVQYVSDQIKNATDLVVSEKEGKVILLVGSKLNYIELK